MRSYERQEQQELKIQQESKNQQEFADIVACEFSLPRLLDSVARGWVRYKTAIAPP